MQCLNLCLQIELSLSICTVIYHKAENCEDLSGTWYNELGSEMIVNHTETGELSGEYRTAVERQPGLAGTSYSLVVGKCMNKCYFLSTV